MIKNTCQQMQVFTLLLLKQGNISLERSGAKKEKTLKSASKYKMLIRQIGSVLTVRGRYVMALNRLPNGVPRKIKKYV